MLVPALPSVLVLKLVPTHSDAQRLLADPEVILDGQLREHQSALRHVADAQTRSRIRRQPRNVLAFEQHLAAAQPALGHRRGQRVGCLVVQLTEQRCLSEHCGVHEWASLDL